MSYHTVRSYEFAIPVRRSYRKYSRICAFCLGIPRGEAYEHSVRAFIMMLDAFGRSLVRYGPHGAENQVVGYRTLLRNAAMAKQGFGLATNLQGDLIPYQVSVSKARSNAEGMPHKRK